MSQGFTQPNINLKKINGVTVLAGTGATGTGSQRVTVAVDSATVAGSASLPAGTNNIGDVDIVTVNGVAPAFGTGVRGATVQRVTVATDDLVPVSLASTTITGTVTTDTELPAAAALADATANPTTPLVGAALETFNGTTWDRARGDITNGLDVDVTRLPALVAGSAIVGKVGIDQTTPGTTNLVALSAETTKVIGTVNQGTSPWVTSLTSTTLTSVTTGTAATNLGKAVDSVAGATDTGVLALAVRDDTLTTLTPIDGDYTQLRTNARGAAWTVLEDGAGGQIGTTSGGTAVNGLNTASNATVFQFSTINSTTAQLAAQATFTGTIESIVSQQSYSILQFSDQPGTLTIKQYTDAGGTKLNQTLTYDTVANTGFAKSGVLNGNYIQITFKNIGNSTTTTLQIDTAFGTIPAATQLNNTPTALNEVGGIAFALGQKPTATSLPVTLPSDSLDIPVGGDLLETILLELQAFNANFGGTTNENRNLRRRLDDSLREVVAIANTPDNIRTTSVTITASTAETTVIPGMQGIDNRLLGLIISNSSASTNTLITIRDSLGGIPRAVLQSVGGSNPIGFTLGGVAIPQNARGGDWTVTCGTSTTSIYVWAIYSIN